MSDHVMTFEEFHHAMRILFCIDYKELMGVISLSQWEKFRNDPWRFFIMADDRVARGIWAIIERRITKSTKEG